jgi:membrane-bound lytic murein transglycosylase C
MALSLDCCWGIVCAGHCVPGDGEREVPLRLLWVFVAISLLTACTVSDAHLVARAIDSKDISTLTDAKADQYIRNPRVLVRDIKTITELLDQLKSQVQNTWGYEGADLPTSTTYVKYTDGYNSKAIIDFRNGRITVETIAKEHSLGELKHALVATILATDDPSSTDIFTDRDPDFTGKPFLLGQVVDQDGKAIQYEWRAKRFAEYLIENHRIYVKASGPNRHSVTFPLVTNHNELRKVKYSDPVLAAAAKYQVAPSLIFAIIETESSFNPFAISTANAYGLMQIIPSTAGKDVYSRVKGLKGQPSADVLFDVKANIDIGAAYLHLLDDVYLNRVADPQSREYATISAYNGGAGNVFKTFGPNREKALAVINRQSPSLVYETLVNEHPRQETQRYLRKVLAFQKNY